MNTLPWAITARFFNSSDTYVRLQAHWSGLVNSDRRHDLAAAHHLLYLALLGKDWRKAFTPITNPRKLANGAFVGWGLFRALASVHNRWREEWLLAPFDGHVTPEMLHLVRSLLPSAYAYSYRPESFSAGTFPFDAYNVPGAMSAATHEELAHG